MTENIVKTQKSLICNREEHEVISCNRICTIETHYVVEEQTIMFVSRVCL